MKPTNAKNVVSKIRKLLETSRELREKNTCFSVTRLTSIKSLSQDEDATAKFALYLAKLTHRKMHSKTCPLNLQTEEWDQHKAMVADAIPQIEDYVETPTPEKRSALRELLSKLEQVQGDGGPTAWGNSLRLIHNTDVLIVEDALLCLLKSDFPFWAYKIARDYAECYTPSYGSGLIPESAQMVKEIAEFWCQYYLGQTLEERFPKKS